MIKSLLVAAGITSLVSATLTVSRCQYSPHESDDGKCCCVRSTNRRYRGTEVQLCLDGDDGLPSFKWAKCPVKEDGKLIRGEFTSEDVRVPREVYEKFFSGWSPRADTLASCKSAFRSFQRNAVGRTWGTASRRVVDNVCSMIDAYEEKAATPKTNPTQKATKFDQFDEFNR